LCLEDAIRLLMVRLKPDATAVTPISTKNLEIVHRVAHRLI
jgi:hypothetical protein